VLQRKKTLIFHGVFINIIVYKELLKKDVKYYMLKNK